MIPLCLTMLVCAVLLRDLGRAWIKRIDMSTYQGKQLESLRDRQKAVEETLDRLRKSG